VAFAHRWLPVRVGTDIALANAMGRVIIQEGLVHEEFVREATEEVPLEGCGNTEGGVPSW
jgi:anaerobic selenocysteine-containing dehydrogenase